MAGPSATGNFAQAGLSAQRENERLLQATLENSPDNSKIVQEVARRKGKEQIKAKQAEQKVRMAELDTYTNVKTKKEVQDAEYDYKKSKAKAGKLAAAGGAIGGGIAMLAPSGRKKREVGSEDSFFQERINKDKAKAQELRTQAAAIDTSGKMPGITPVGGEGTIQATRSGGSASTTPTNLQGVRKEFADAIAGPESGSWGYEAFNQGGAEGGTKVLGKSGSHKETFGRSLQDMTLGEIFQKQNLGGSNAEFQAAGGLHAVGRYQFIGPTLQEETARMGLSHDTKFTPQVQDDIFFSHAKRIGNISPWIGPSVNYGADKRNHLNSLIPQL